MPAHTRGISGITLENIGRFEFFNMALQDGEIVEIQGDNDEGKSTIPLCITAALFGTLDEKTSANHLSTDGTGKQTLEIGGYTITRVVRDRKTVGLDVVDRNGSRPYQGKAIQEWLDKTFGKLKGKQAGCFINPFELMTLPKKEQIAAIVKVLPIDLDFARDRIRAITGGAFDVSSIASTEGVFTAISRLDADWREERLALGKRVDAAEAAYAGALQALPEDFSPDNPLPVKPAPMDELYRDKEKIVRANNRRAEITRSLSENDAEIRRLEERIAELTNRNTALRDELHGLGAVQNTDSLQEKIDAHEESMRQYQQALERHGDLNRRFREKSAFYDQWQEIKAKHGDLDGKVKALAKLPAELFSRAELPVSGLFIEGDTIMLPDEKTGDLRPAEEFGDARLLDLYIALAMALAPIPVILADGLERCGPKRSQEIYDRIRAKGFQFLGVRVTDGEIHARTITPEGAQAKAITVKVGEVVEEPPVAIPEPEHSEELDFDVPEIDD